MSGRVRAVVPEAPVTSGDGATAALARVGRAVALETLPPDALAVAKHCLLDWLGVALAGSREPLTEILAAELTGPAGGEATLIGRPDRVSAHTAALLNGAAAHALDFDDTHLTMLGHPTAPVAAAVVALAERLGCKGAELLAALVAGVEVECRLGALVNPSHYKHGWHATGTLGTFGAAAGCARLLNLDEQRWLHAMGIAGTQAAGVKGVFGTMCKPLHAGRAAANGLLAAVLASRGFTSSLDILEGPQGFVDCHDGQVPGPAALEEFAERYLIRETLFKYHAACYFTHGVIEAALLLRHDHGLGPDEVGTIEVEVNPAVLDVANIASPRTGLEGKFSLRAVTAMALLGDDTADPAAYSAERMAAPDLIEMRDRVRVSAAELELSAGTVRVHASDGRELVASGDTSIPAADLELQHTRLAAKFTRLAEPVLGEERVAALADLVDRLEHTQSVSELMSLAVP